MIRLFWASLITLCLTSSAMASSGMMPGPGVGAFVSSFSKLLVTPDGSVLNTSGEKFLKTPGTESWNKLTITPDGTLLKTADNKLLKTP